MSNQNQKPAPQKRSASERLADLEVAVSHLYQLSDSFIKDMTMFKKTLGLLNSKVSAITKASLAGEEPNDDVLNRIMMESEVADLEQRTKVMVEQGFLVPNEGIEDNSFVAGKEMDSNDIVTNPRIQFVFSTLKPEFKEKLVGKKPGEVVLLQENVKFQVLESYLIQQPQPVAPAPETEVPSEPQANESEPTPVPST
jgi:hypothetical protein